VIELPKAWTQVTFDCAFDRLQYGHTAKAAHDCPGVRFLRITDLTDGKIDWASVPGIESTDNTDQYILRDGDFVFARSGSVEKAARILSPPPAVFASYLIRGRPKDSRIADWLAYFIRSEDYLEQIRQRVAGIGLSNVNASKLSTIRLPLPPLPEQRRIVAKLDSLTRRTGRARERLGRIPNDFLLLGPPADWKWQRRYLGDAERMKTGAGRRNALDGGSTLRGNQPIKSIFWFKSDIHPRPNDVILVGAIFDLR
jgi:type I restriction enzyme, S subunit